MWNTFFLTFPLQLIRTELTIPVWPKSTLWSELLPTVWCIVTIPIKSSLTTSGRQRHPELSFSMVQYNPCPKDHQRIVWLRWRHVKSGVVPGCAPSDAAVEVGAEGWSSDTWGADAWGSTVNKKKSLFLELMKKIKCGEVLRPTDSGGRGSRISLPPTKIHGWFGRWGVGPSGASACSSVESSLLAVVDSQSSSDSSSGDIAAVRDTRDNVVGVRWPYAPQCNHYTKRSYKWKITLSPTGAYIW